MGLVLSRMASALIRLDVGPIRVVAGTPLLDALWVGLLAFHHSDKEFVGLHANKRLPETGDLLVGAVDRFHVGGKGSLGWGCC